jgi:transcriptional regulator with XRE-family HTH domain
LHQSVAFLLPGISVVLVGKKPEVAAHAGDTLGAQLWRRRKALKLRRIDAAVLLGADPKSLMWWERDERQPFVQFYPALISFLGYEPWTEPQTLGEALLAERRRRGLSVKIAAPLIGVYEGTWLRWERGEWRPMRQAIAKIDGFLGFSCRERYPAQVR